MKKITIAVVLALFLLSLSAPADEKEAVGKAQAAAKSWLALTDAGKYGQSWDEAASFFKAAITKADWEKALNGIRSPLGSVKSREVKSATFTRSVPGAPDGEYVVIRFETQFQNKALAIEKVTPVREKDGSWRVSGYFIR